MMREPQKILLSQHQVDDLRKLWLSKDKDEADFDTWQRDYVEVVRPYIPTLRERMRQLFGR